MKNFLLEFNAKVEMTLKKKPKDWKRIYTGTLSRTSLRSIGNHYIGETLNENMLEIVGQNVRENTSKILVEAIKYARCSRSSKVKVEHLLYAMQMQGINLDLLHVDFDWPEVEDRVESVIRLPNMKRRSIIRALQSSSPVEKKKLCQKGILKPWVKREQVLLMQKRKFPLSKEQQKYYILITESLMGPSDTLRREALRSVNTDSSLQPMLSKLCLFIAEGVKVNILQHNVALLLYLMRLVHSLLGNSNLRLNNYLHLLIPSVISCVVARQICGPSTVQNHWTLREYASNIVTEFVRTYNSKENNLLGRIISLYKDGLQASSLTTIYGSLIGLQKMGKFPIREYIVPQISYISDRIEPYFKGGGTDFSNKHASIFIRYRILKMCAPMLKKMNRAPDQLEEYMQRYHFLGQPLYEAVVIERIGADAFEQAAEYGKLHCHCYE